MSCGLLYGQSSRYGRKRNVMPTNHGRGGSSMASHPWLRWPRPHQSPQRHHRRKFSVDPVSAFKKHPGTVYRRLRRPQEAAASLHQCAAMVSMPFLCNHCPLCTSRATASLHLSRKRLFASLPQGAAGHLCRTALAVYPSTNASTCSAASRGASPRRPPPSAPTSTYTV